MTNTIEGIELDVPWMVWFGLFEFYGIEDI